MKTKSDDPADIGLKSLSPQPQEQPPPPYVDREEARRARLLENAAREARERKQAREGSAASRPGTAAAPPPPMVPSPAPAPAPEPQPQPQPKTPSPEPKDSSDTARLLSNPPSARSGPSDDDPQSPRRRSAATPQGLAGMSINDILKMKMAQKADGKRKPRKIIST
jgi:hypothetical protein